VLKEIFLFFDIDSFELKGASINTAIMIAVRLVWRFFAGFTLIIFITKFCPDDDPETR
jgi:hypothetical protein